MLDPVTTTVVLSMVLPGIIGKCIDVTTNMGMDKWKELTAVGNAVNEFSKQFPLHQTEIGNAFRSWAQSDEFASSIPKIGRWTLEDAVASFSRLSKLNSSPVEEIALDELVAEFLIELAVQLEIIDPAMRAREARFRHLEILAELDKLKTRFELGNMQILRRMDEMSPPKIFSYEINELEERLPKEVAFHAQIDGALEHLKHGKANLAKEKLLGLRAEVNNENSLYLKSRVANALGACYMRLEILSLAKDEYQNALNLKQSRLNYSNLAAAKLNIGDNVDALELSRQAIAIVPTNGRTVAIHIQALHINGKISEADEQKERHKDLCASDPNCLLALGQLAYDQGDYPAAKGYFEKAYEVSPYDFQFNLLIANCILKTVETPFQSMTPLDGILPAEAVSNLKEVRRLTEEALTHFKDDDYSLNKIRALEFRSAAAFLEMDHANAERDCLAILSLDPDNQIALMKMGFLALSKDNGDRAAILFFEKVRSEVLAPVAVVAAGAYINENEVEKAKACLELFKQQANKKKLWYAYAHERLRVAELEQTQDAVIAELLEEYGETGDVLFAIGEVYKKRRETVKALEFFDRANCASETSTLKLFIPRMKAQIYFDAALWEPACKIYSSMPHIKSHTRDWYEYICAMANIPNQSLLGSAGAEAKLAREANGGQPIPTISEIEAVAKMDKFKDPRGALILLMALYESQPNNPKLLYLIRLANFKIGRAPNDFSNPYG